MQKNIENIKNNLELIIKSGKFSLGYNTTIKELKNGNCKLIIISNTCPSKKRLEIEYFTMINNSKLHYFHGDGFDLGAMCGKPFSCSCFGIIDPGNADISSFVQK